MLLLYELLVRLADESVWQSQFNYVASAHRFTAALHSYVYYNKNQINFRFEYLFSSW